MRSRKLDFVLVLVLIACMVAVWHFRHRPTVEAMKAEHERAQELLEASEWREAGLHLERALRMARQLERPDEEFELLDDLGWAHFELGEREQAHRWQAEAVEVVEKVKGPNDPTLGLYLVRLAKVTPDPKQAREILNRAESIYRKAYNSGQALDALLQELAAERAKLKP